MTVQQLYDYFDPIERKVRKVCLDRSNIMIKFYSPENAYQALSENAIKNSKTIAKLE